MNKHIAHKDSPQIQQFKSRMGNFLDGIVKKIDNDHYIHSNGLFLTQAIIEKIVGDIDGQIKVADVKLPLSCKQFIKENPSFVIHLNYGMLSDMNWLDKILLNRHHKELEPWIAQRFTRSLWNKNREGYHADITEMAKMSKGYMW